MSVGQFPLPFWVGHLPPDNSPDILTYMYAYTHIYIHTYTDIHTRLQIYYACMYKYMYVKICQHDDFI